MPRAERTGATPNPIDPRTGKPFFGGKPTWGKWESEEQLQSLINDYFDNTDVPNICGLALALDTWHKKLWEYVTDSESQVYCPYRSTLKKAVDRLYKDHAERLIRGKQNPAGVIFVLKNMGWKDTQEITQHVDDLRKPMDTEERRAFARMMRKDQKQLKAEKAQEEVH